MADRKDGPNWGPDNPHPLSQIKTELIWEGKYDEYGNRRPISLPPSPLPLQRIETVDEPHDRVRAQHGQAAPAQLALWEKEFQAQAHRDDFRNMLIWGDNKLAMHSLLEQFRGQVDLIYIDPPFDVGADFTLEAQLGSDSTKVAKGQSVLEAVAYRDMWGRGQDSYLHMMQERLSLMHKLLAPRGSLVVHVDRRVSSMIRLLLDEIFGGANQVNEIVWCYTGPSSPGMRQFSNKHDTLFWYAKGQEWTFNVDEVRLPYKETTLRNEGRRTGWTTGNPDHVVKLNPLGKYPEDWWLLHVVPPASHERLPFPTQKPESVLTRVIEACSNPHDLIADFFCGSGTTLAVAEKLGRRWIGVDLGRYAIHTTRKRVIQVQRDLYAAGQPYRSFDVYNLGRYERQWWQVERLAGADREHRALVLRFYKAAPLERPPSPLLHGRKAGAYVHVAPIDTIFGRDDLLAVAEAAHAAGARQVDCLAWEFEMELARERQAIAHELGIEIRLKYIPREIMEPNREEVQFFEAGYVAARVVRRDDGGVDVRLIDFAPALAEVPQKEMEALRERAVRSPFDFIDFWAVDFEYRDDKPFEHHWQDFRTRQDRGLEAESDLGWRYTTPGPHRIGVKVIDVFGVDTSTVLDVGIDPEG